MPGTAGGKPPDEPHPLDSETAGGSVVRGGVSRLVGYGVGTVAAIAATSVIVRTLGVVDTGRFVTVMSVVLIIGNITDLGLATIGIREYAQSEGGKRREFLGNLLGMRLVLGVLGVAAAVIFGIVVDYTTTMVVGIVVAGVGMLLYAIQQALTIPFYADLRFGWIAAIQLVFQVGVLIAAVVVALVDPGLLGFLGIQIPVMFLVLALTVVVGGPATRVLPAVDAPEWRRTIRRILPYAAASVLAVLEFRVVQIMVSLLSTGVQAGYFGAVFRLVDGVSTIPLILVSTAFPVLVRAAERNSERFTKAGRRVAEAMLLSGVGVSVALFLGARFAIDVVAGPGFGGAVDTLRIVAIALTATFLSAARGYALLSLDEMRATVVSNAIALGTVVIVGIPLIQDHGAVGAAITLVAGEFALVASYEVSLTRHRRELRLPIGFVVRVALAAAIAVGPMVVLQPPSLVALIIGGIVYPVALYFFGAIPTELWQAFRRRGEPALRRV